MDREITDPGETTPGTRYPVGAVDRLDLFQLPRPELASEIGEVLREAVITVKEILPTYEGAVAEVERLARLRGDDSDVVYFAQGSRFYPAGRKGAPGELTATESLLAEVTAQIGRSAGGVPMQRQRFEIEIAAIYDRCVSTFAAVRLLLRHGFAHEALALSRALYTESLMLEELAAENSSRRLELVLGWQLGAVTDWLGTLQQAKAGGDDVTTEIAVSEQARSKLHEYAQRSGIKSLRAWKPDEKKLAQRHRGGDGYLDFRTSHHFVHGSAFAAGERYREVAERVVAVGGRAAQTDIWAAPVGLAAAMSVLKAADAAHRIFDWPGGAEIDDLITQVEAAGQALDDGKHSDDAHREEVLDELTREAERLGLDY